MPPPIPQSLLASIFPSPLPPISLTKKPNLLSSPRPSRCPVLSVATEAPATGVELRSRPSPAEASRTILELSSTGTLSTLTADGWPLGIGARFVADPRGAPALCLRGIDGVSAAGVKSSFHVRFEQSGARTPQCTLLGILNKPKDELLLKKLSATWEKKFGEELAEDLLYIISVERVLQMDDLKEEGILVTPSDYANAEPDPLRNFAQDIVAEMNSSHVEDVQRLYHVYVDSEFQVGNAKMIWVDRLGFDLYLHSANGVFAARIPFPREVTDQKGAKSTFNSMSHLAWEIERGYVEPDFEKVNCLKIR